MSKKIVLIFWVSKTIFGENTVFFILPPPLPPLSSEDKIWALFILQRSLNRAPGDQLSSFFRLFVFSWTSVRKKRNNLLKYFQIEPNLAKPSPRWSTFFVFTLFLISWIHIWKKLYNLLEISSNWVKSDDIDLQIIHIFRFFVFSFCPEYISG